MFVSLLSSSGFESSCQLSSRSLRKRGATGLPTRGETLPEERVRETFTDAAQVTPSRASAPLGAVLPILATITICFSLSLSPRDAAADDQKAGPAVKSFRDGAAAHTNPYGFTVDSAFDILNDTASTDLYDPITISTLRRLKEDAQPAWDGDDIDPEKTRRVVERAFAIQSGRNLSSTIEKSELKPLYQDIKDGLKEVQDTFRYSVQSNGDSLAVSRKKKGEKLLELNVELSLKQGLDPQFKLGENVRFRYDYSNQRPLLEYGFKF